MKHLEVIILGFVGLIITLVFGGMLYIINLPHQEPDHQPVKEYTYREYDEAIEENLQLRADYFDLSLNTITMTSGEITVVFDHYKGQMITPENQEALEAVAKYIYYYTDPGHTNIYNTSKIKFSKTQNTSYRINGYLELVKEDGQDYIMINDQKVAVGELYHSLADTSYKTILADSEILKSLGYEVNEYSKLYIIKEKNNHTQKQPYEEYKDAINYHDYIEFHEDYPELTEDEAEVIFNYYHQNNN